MTVQDIEARVEHIRAIIDRRVKSNSLEGDAHEAEEEIYAEVLRAIAAGAENARELAVAALKAKEIEFSRWYD